MTIIVMGSFIARAQTVGPSKPVADSLKVVDSLPVRKHVVKRSHPEIGMTYQSNDVYLGRRDSARLPYFIPAVSYYHKSGVFATASVDYLKTAAVSRVDLVSVDAGYMFTAHKYDGTFTFTKYWYNHQSTNVASDIRAAIAYMNGYDLGFVKPRVTTTLNFGDKVDFEGVFDLEHTFVFFHDDMDVTPTISVAGSTLHFYDYYRRRKYKLTRNAKKKAGIANVTGSVVGASSFRIMDYEPSVPLEYTIGKFTVNFTPIYALPVNPATIDVHTVKENGVATDRTKQEKIGNTFFFTCEVSFLF
jgi:hypothetical protein